MMQRERRLSERKTAGDASTSSSPPVTLEAAASLTGQTIAAEPELEGLR